MQIPKRFRLMGEEITVEHTTELLHKDDCRGLAAYRDNKIVLQKPCEGNPLPLTHPEQSFCHELVHYLFYFGEFKEDCKNEAKVNLLSRLLHQALSTMEFE